MKRGGSVDPVVAILSQIAIPGDAFLPEMFVVRALAYLNEVHAA